ncbi:MAG: hypothetical protein QM528_09025 [Phycisphaerales bacterium]|nr:hypothetical protein [Phycisphaerales bacterium]
MENKLQSIGITLKRQELKNSQLKNLTGGRKRKVCGDNDVCITLSGDRNTCNFFEDIKLGHRVCYSTGKYPAEDYGDDCHPQARCYCGAPDFTGHLCT